jgi:dihydrofolate reductase
LQFNRRGVGDLKYKGDPMSHTCRLSIIAAIAENGIIGKDGTLPWHLPADLKYFRQVTSGHTVIMGRKNYEDIGRPLPNRVNIVLSRDGNFRAEGCLSANSIEQAISLAGDESEIFFIGGARVYEQILPHADRLYLSKIHGNIEGDTHFPKFDEREWKRVAHDLRPADHDNPYAISFDVYERAHAS